MSDRMPTLQIKYNTAYPVELLYDQPKQGESQYGKYNLYSLMHGGTQFGLFAEDALHEELKNYKKGDRVVIERSQDSKGGLQWSVSQQNGSPNHARTANNIDRRTMEIYRSLALKIATMSIGQSLQKWGQSELDEIQERMEHLLLILIGEVHEELPF
ncbi:hypothetical protein ACFL5D_05500 [Candidatus Neomarinimicrobiota bacterium]